MGLCVKNAEETVEKAIDSIKNQDFPQDLMEAIFVEDGSQDETSSILLNSISKMGMPAIVLSNEGRGLGAARQTVVDKARGEYIVWVDDDIVLPKDFVRKQVEFMDQNPQVGASQGKERYKEGNLVSAIINLSLCLEEQPGTGGSIFRLDCLTQVGGFDRRIEGACEDIDVVARIKSAGWQVCVNQELDFHHFHEPMLRDLWNQYFWYGYGGHYINHKLKYFRLPYMVPLVRFGRRLRQSIQLYKSIRGKKTFLVPLLCAFRRLAWLLGFVKSHIDGYGHARAHPQSLS